MIIYRIENKQGYGPFFSKRKCLTALTSHNDPEKMLPSAELTKESFKNLCKKGWVFGWRTKELYDKFFTKYGRDALYAEGFEDKIYYADEYVEFEDGQVMFFRKAA